MKERFTLSLLLLILLMSFSLQAQNSAEELDDMLAPATNNNVSDADSLNNDVIRVNYSKKNAGLAMLMSGLLPGAGQFYVEKSAITAYLFPVIELAIIGGIVYFNNQGNKKVDEYKKYANGEVVSFDVNGYTYTGTRYNREFQSAVEDTIKRVHNFDIYDNTYFSLDETNSQHFYEDIGKYNKYIFGWADWYLTYAEQGVQGTDITNPNPHPLFAWRTGDTDQDFIWIGNQPLNDPQGEWLPPKSSLRTKYIQLRQEAEDQYRVANYLSFGIAFNHIISAIDAARMTSNRNRLYLSENKVKMNYYAALNNGNFTPMLGMTYKF